MRLKKILGAAAVALGMTVAGLGFSAPAFAGTYGYAAINVEPFDWEYRGSVDNRAGNRVVLSSKRKGFHIDLYEYNTAGNMYKLYVDKDRTYTWYLPQPVSDFRICGPNGIGGDVCTGWQHLDR